MTTRIKTKRYWYFVTQENMGLKMALSPRTPHSMSDTEPLIQRICVAPTAAHCMAAIGFCSGTPIYIYRTLRQVTGVEAYRVSDSDITDEHFLLTKTRFELVGIIAKSQVKRMNSRALFEDRGALKDTKGYQDQKLQYHGIVNSISRYDKRLTNSKYSNDRFKFESVFIGEWGEHEKKVELDYFKFQNSIRVAKTAEQRSDAMAAYVVSNMATKCGAPLEKVEAWWPPTGVTKTLNFISFSAKVPL